MSVDMNSTDTFCNSSVEAMPLRRAVDTSTIKYLVCFLVQHV